MSHDDKRLPVRRTGNYGQSRFNALKHGLLSNALLPFENQEACRKLCDALRVEYRPQGPIEENLVHDLAFLILRLNRVPMVERGAFARALERVIAANPAEDKAALLSAACATDDQVARYEAELAKSRSTIAEAVRLLEQGSADAYRHALTVLTPEENDEWLQYQNPPASGIAAHVMKYASVEARLLEFLRSKVIRKICDHQDILDNRSRIRDLALGDPDYISALKNVARYEAELDRKKERLLTVLLRLQERRRTLNSD